MRINVAAVCGAALACLVFGGCTQNDSSSQEQSQSDSNGAVRPEATAAALAKKIPVFYTKSDGEHLGKFRVALGKAHDVESVAYFAAICAVKGPVSEIPAIHFPQGTSVRSVHVEGSTATVDLSKDVNDTPSGGFSEGGEFKALVWTLTAIPGISHVKILIGGATVPTLPGGHFELDEPLSRADW